MTVNIKTGGIFILSLILLGATEKADADMVMVVPDFGAAIDTDLTDGVNSGGLFDNSGGARNVNNGNAALNMLLADAVTLDAVHGDRHGRS